MIVGGLQVFRLRRRQGRQRRDKDVLRWRRDAGCAPVPPAEDEPEDDEDVPESGIRADGSRRPRRARGRGLGRGRRAQMLREDVVDAGNLPFNNIRLFGVADGRLRLLSSRAPPRRATARRAASATWRIARGRAPLASARRASIPEPERLDRPGCASSTRRKPPLPRLRRPARPGARGELFLPPVHERARQHFARPVAGERGERAPGQSRARASSAAAIEDRSRASAAAAPRADSSRAPRGLRAARPRPASPAPRAATSPTRRRTPRASPWRSRGGARGKGTPW